MILLHSILFSILPMLLSGSQRISAMLRQSFIPLVLCLFFFLNWDWNDLIYSFTCEVRRLWHHGWNDDYVKIVSKFQDNEWTRILPRSLIVHSSEGTLINEYETPLNKWLIFKYGSNLDHWDIFSIGHKMKGKNSTLWAHRPPENIANPHKALEW